MASVIILSKYIASDCVEAKTGGKDGDTEPLMCLVVATETIPAIDIACPWLKYVINTSSLSLKRLLRIEMCSCYVFIICPLFMGSD